MVLHDRPACAPSSVSISKSAASSRTGTPHSASWYAAIATSSPEAHPQRRIVTISEEPDREVKGATVLARERVNVDPVVEHDRPDRRLDADPRAHVGPHRERVVEDVPRIEVQISEVGEHGGVERADDGEAQLEARVDHEVAAPDRDAHAVRARLDAEGRLLL